MLISKFDSANIEEAVNAFEEKHSFTFPEQYKRFLLKYNGGETPKTSFKINGVSSDVRGCFGLARADENYNYSFFEKTQTLTDYLDDDVVPIATSSFGDDIVIGVGSVNQGKIYFLYHDMPKEYKELTHSFLEFIEQCKSEKIRHIRTIEERKRGLREVGSSIEVNEELISLWQAEIDKYASIQQEKVVLD